MNQKCEYQISRIIFWYYIKPGKCRAQLANRPRWFTLKKGKWRLFSNLVSWGYKIFCEYAIPVKDYTYWHTVKFHIPYFLLQWFCGHNNTRRESPPRKVNIFVRPMKKGDVITFVKEFLSLPLLIFHHFEYSKPESRYWPWYLISEVCLACYQFTESKKYENSKTHQ